MFLKISQQSFLFVHVTDAVRMNKEHSRKSELMLMIRARVYSSSCLQVILVYLHPFCRISHFCSQKSPKII